MEQVKSFRNMTTEQVELTLYIASAEHDLLTPHGSRITVIAPGQEEQVSFGSLRQPYLNGIKVSLQSEQDQMSFERWTRYTGSPADLMLNHNDAFCIVADETLRVLPK
ncbi:hypothetical protein [Agaribacterium haliotis]|uniref:hypothetical protein n=1 Tax=Agaribacterium haliotis TaxID=2013869 RepID=UPI000BB5465C|nr:hypothetical protein [Agaribacterium haliotis]